MSVLYNVYRQLQAEILTKREENTHCKSLRGIDLGQICPAIFSVHIRRKGRHSEEHAPDFSPSSLRNDRVDHPAEAECAVSAVESLNRGK